MNQSKTADETPDERETPAWRVPLRITTLMLGVALFAVELRLLMLIEPSEDKTSWRSWVLILGQQAIVTAAIAFIVIVPIGRAARRARLKRKRKAHVERLKGFLRASGTIASKNSI